jgi:FlaG/FlaF family flagellin (archaellin)
MNKMVNGEVVAMTDAEVTARNAEVAASEADEAANGYKRKRASEYPSIVDQLDDIYHNGIDAWKATIKATKDKYPKP